MTLGHSFDLVVLGAGPAGASAAIAARRQGLRVAVVDEAQRAGGQVYRAPGYAASPDQLKNNPDLARGEKLRADLAASGAEQLFGHKLWFAAPGIRLSTVSGKGPHWFDARAFVIATGTTERIIPVPGATLPGVIGLAAATILLKAHGAIPQGPTVVAGVGPLLYAVAAGILKAGGSVAAVVDLAHPADWAKQLPGLLSRPDLLLRGAQWMWKLRAAGVPIRFGHALSSIDGDDAVRAVTIAPVDRQWNARPGAKAETLAAAFVCVGHGLVPATETARLLGVPHQYRAERGGFVPVVADDRSTPVAGVYVAGDCAGISGAAAAEHAGTLAGLAAARDLGALAPAAFAQAVSPVRAALSRAERFGWSISALMALRPGLVRAMRPETVVCRCEDVSCATIERAARAGAIDVNQLKSTTRCGMGPCQGRMCGEAAAELIAAGGAGSREAAGQWTARTPLRTVPVAALVGSYDYDDIPRPPPLPG
ncbi:MAG: FAD-dependent oxidoreductase [Burkholderiaceae bacterium]|nr:FAD-dependent oxidoreductase [Burkholderiaceae bacterium]